jgi:hypothetical protein
MKSLSRLIRVFALALPLLVVVGSAPVTAADSCCKDSCSCCTSCCQDKDCCANCGADCCDSCCDC